MKPVLAREFEAGRRYVVDVGLVELCRDFKHGGVQCAHKGNLAATIRFFHPMV
jgi:hypothetical protein